MSKEKEVYVVTSTEMGWDCVQGVYAKKEDAEFNHLYREEDWDEDGNLSPNAEPLEQMVIHGPLTLH